MVFKRFNDLPTQVTIFINALLGFLLIVQMMDFAEAQIEIETSKSVNLFTLNELGSPLFYADLI